MRRKYSFFFVMVIAMASLIISCEKTPKNVIDVTQSPTAGGQQGNSVVQPPVTDGSEALPTATPSPITTPTPAAHPETLVTFSLPDNFQFQTTELTLTCEGAERIYYTMDGTIPDETKTLYQGPITLTAKNEAATYPISARGYFSDGTKTETCIRTYFAGTELASRYDCLVFCITTDPYNLYDYEYGIFTGGKLLDEYLKANPYAKVDGSTPANYHMRGAESERPVYVEVFNSDGSLVLEQNGGVRTYGGWSRANVQTPMKLFARKEYSETDNKFRYPFFVASVDEKGETIDSFKRLVLRSCGNDNGFAFLREELFQTLGKQAGYEGKSVRPCAVYVNGAYYGFYWLTEVYHESFFETHYGKFPGKIEILEGDEKYKTEDEENQYAVNDYQTIYNTYSYADLTNEALYSELCKVIDVQNYLEYYAFNLFIGNEDWPHNNYKVYRYYAAEGEAYANEAPFDGKWRYLLHDMDFSTGIYGSNAMEHYLHDYLGRIGGIKDACPLFGSLMVRQDCRDIFIRKTLDLINGVFNDTNFVRVSNELAESREQELYYTMEAGKFADWINMSQVEWRLSSLNDYITMRRNYVYNLLHTFFKLPGTKYTLEMPAVSGSVSHINSYATEEDFSGKYLSAVDTVCSLEIKNGLEFDYWLVDDVKYYDKEFVITSDIVGEKSELKISAVLK